MPIPEVPKKRPFKIVSREKLKLWSKILSNTPHKRTRSIALFFFIIFFNSFEQRIFKERQQEIIVGLIILSIKTLVSIFVLPVFQILFEAFEPNFIVAHSPIELAKQNKYFMQTFIIN